MSTPFVVDDMSDKVRVLLGTNYLNY